MHSLSLTRLDDARAERRFAPRTIPEQVAEELGAAIINGRLKAGDRLIEADLAAKFGISRGPVRDAIRILERRRLVEMQPRRGAYVRAVALSSIADLFNVRRALSMLAVRSFAAAPIESFIDTLARRVAEMRAHVSTGSPVAFAQITTRAVRTIARGSGNELLIELMKDLAEQTVWTTIWKAPLDYQTPAIRKAATDAMERVLAAIRGGDPDGAEKELGDLLEADRERALASLSSTRRHIGIARSAT
jgi:DNA-binding GntR family transcriptional regulator